MVFCTTGHTMPEQIQTTRTSGVTCLGSAQLQMLNHLYKQAEDPGHIWPKLSLQHQDISRKHMPTGAVMQGPVPGPTERQKSSSS